MVYWMSFWNLYLKVELSEIRFLGQEGDTLFGSGDGYEVLHGKKDGKMEKITEGNFHFQHESEELD